MHKFRILIAYVDFCPFIEFFFYCLVLCFKLFLEIKIDFLILIYFNVLSALSLHTIYENIMITDAQTELLS